MLIGNQIPAVLICKCSGDSPSGNLFAIVPGSCHMYLKMVCNILEASKIFLSLFRYLGCNFLILNCLAVTQNGLAVWGDNCFMKIFLADDSFFYFTYSSCNWCPRFVSFRIPGFSLNLLVFNTYVLESIGFRMVIAK